MKKIENRIAEAKAKEGMPEMPEVCALEKMPGGFTLIGAVPQPAAHLLCLLIELVDEHAVVKAAHDAARGTTDESVAEAAHMQNHTDIDTVKEALKCELEAAFDEVGTTYDETGFMAGWKVIGRKMGPLEGFLRALTEQGASLGIAVVPVRMRQN